MGDGGIDIRSKVEANSLLRQQTIGAYCVSGSKTDDVPTEHGMSLYGIKNATERYSRTVELGIYPLGPLHNQMFPPKYHPIIRCQPR